MIDKYKKEACPTCGAYINRGVTVNALVFNKKGEILIIKRGIEPFKDWWGLPGGYVEWDESVKDAVKRELLEEASMEAVSFKLLGVYSHPQRSEGQTINISYVVSAKGEPKAGDDAIEIRFCQTADLPKLAFDHIKMIEDAKLLKLV